MLRQGDMNTEDLNDLPYVIRANRSPAGPR